MNEIAARRAKSGKQTSMFLRILMRGAVVRRGRALAALSAVVVAAAVATAMLNLYVDVEAKLRREFRSYGANVVVVAKEGQALPADALTSAEQVLGGKGLAVPFAYAVAHTPEGKSMVVAGTDFARVQQLNHWWSVTAWPKAEHEVLVGTRAAAALGAQGGPVSLVFDSRTVQFTPAGTLRTGADEDSRIYVSLPEFIAWTGVPPSSIEIAANGSAEEVTKTIQRLAQALPSAQVQPVRQIVEGEARVLGKTRASLYAAAALIILTAMVCVLATLTGWVLDRRRDFAIMKALGASEKLISSVFAAEAAALGAIGSLIGFLIGIGVAAWIGRVNFHAPVVPRISVLPVVLFGSVAVALLSALIPMMLLRRVQPAMILRGE